MKMVIQRVSEASVKVDETCIGKIGKGLLVFLGIGAEDTIEIADKMVDKMCKLRIFEDKNGKTNLALGDVAGELLIISQFTLYADCRKGNRPNFVKAGPPEAAEELYHYVLKRCTEINAKTESGEFGADMKVELVNSGPFTIILDSRDFIL